MTYHERLLIIGNSGSGKTWLSKEIGRRGRLPTLHLDDIRWQPGRYGVPRENAAAMRDVARAAEADQWVMEGVYGWLVQNALPRVTRLVWLDLPKSALPTSNSVAIREAALKRASASCWTG
ncbi:hypothetical protein [Falsirhodobacter xinxiangensis]|uniref:hypothetical protein n=1 Tax=Falsirhodobacter xinxiangensis TaxID=2530049 RepID=UPI0010A9E694|nr:hypothetical protein [Rhodobacter xinxiangensis]